MPSATLSKEKIFAVFGVKCYDGFYENAYRLLFAYEDLYASTAPQLLTILPSGTVENNKKLEPEKGKGLLAYSYAQTIDASRVESLRKIHGDLIDPFIQRRDDGTFSLVQAWPTSYNEAWKKNFSEHITNPSEAHFQDLAAKEFHEAIIRLFGEEARSQPVKFAASSKRNDKPVYLGRGDKLIQFLRSSSEVCDALNIPKLLDDGFVAKVVRKDKDAMEKEFHMNMTVDYALYTKQGYETMACCKPLEQFNAEATLDGPKEGPLTDGTLVETLSEKAPLAAIGSPQSREGTMALSISSVQGKRKHSYGGEIEAPTKFGSSTMQKVRYPMLYQINTRVHLTDLSRALDRPATLDDIPDSELDSFAEMGFDWIWLLSVWQTGLEGQRVSRTNPEWRHEYEKTLSDLREDDIGGSGFAIASYKVHHDLGGEEALARLRERLRLRGLRLMLDFVPNHTAIDHGWVEEHPEYYVQGTDEDIAQTPLNYVKVKQGSGHRILAHGRDPYFPGWPDTLQLNYSNPCLQNAMVEELLRVSRQCDGVRCDMAMLLLPDVFEKTWGLSTEAFWPKAIARVRQQAPEFCFLAEVYWDREWTLLQQGFDYAYDKRLYDRLRTGQARNVREHLQAELDFQNKVARFLENHDEPRAAAAFTLGNHEAAAVITYLSPGLRFFHEGQFEGRRKRISPHLVRAPHEPLDESLQAFYKDLLAVSRCPVIVDGEWRLLQCSEAWDGNWTWDCFVAWSWQATSNRRILIVVNYAGNQSQCYVKLPLSDLAGRNVHLQDRLSSSSYERDGSSLIATGLYLDLPAWGRHVFTLSTV